MARAARAATYNVLATTVSTSTGERYEIREGRDGETYCNCMGWRFSKASPKTCKHLARYLAELNTPHAVTMFDAPAGTSWTPPPNPLTAMRASVTTLTTTAPPMTQTVTALDRALGITRLMVLNAGLTHLLSAKAVERMAQELVTYLPSAPAPAPVPIAAEGPRRIRLITFD